MCIVNSLTEIGAQELPTTSVETPLVSFEPRYLDKIVKQSTHELLCKP